MTINILSRMSRVQWKSRRTALVVFIIVLSYFLLRIKNYDYYRKVSLKHVKPMVAWEYVADFSNMRELNPTIENFLILSESGHYDNWKYSVEYSERLSHWPYLRNTAIASFDVKILPKNVYVIVSEHKTCFFLGTICLISLSEFKFTKEEPSSTLAEELISYQCPAILSSMCHHEVQYQRDQIFANLVHWSQPIKSKNH